MFLSDLISGILFTVGGSTLFIETTVKAKTTGSSSPLYITGQLGDVMKESCQIAYTYAKVCCVKSNAKSCPYIQRYKFVRSFSTNLGSIKY